MSRLFKNGENQITQIYKEGIHNGIDLVRYKSNFDYIIAHSDGIVVDVRKDYKTTDKTGNSYGNYVKIQHANGMYTLYAHLKYNSVTVDKNQNVKKGDVIGYMGDTGHCNGAHLHFELRNESNVRIDPTQYLDSDLPGIVTEQKDNVPEETTIFNNDMILILTKRTIRGDFGNGETRKQKLGKYYDVVQKQVNLNFKNKTTTWNNIKLY